MSEYKFQDRSLSVDVRVRALLDELTLDEKASMLSTYQPPIERLSLKGFPIGAEVARGLVCRGRTEEPTTVFPQPFGLAATFDPEIMHRMGEITGIESRIYHKQGKTSLCVWGPTVDAERDPRWGRTEEAYGEDPYLIGEMSRAYTMGMAGDDPDYLRVLPMLKHFYANNNEENRGVDNAMIPLGLKHDYYLKAFETAIRYGGAKGVMTSYNEINGVEGLCNPELENILKKEWGMLFSVTDGGDFMQNLLSHKSDDCYSETARRVFKYHGADIMTDSSFVVKNAVLEAVNNKELSESDLDAALFGVLKARFLLDEIDGGSKYDEYPDELLCCEEHYKATRRAAIESAILLRNDDNILPFDPEKTTAVIGIHADMNFRDWYTGISDRCDTFKNTILDSVYARCGTDKVLFDMCNDFVAIKDPETGLYLGINDDGSLSPKFKTICDECTFELFDWGENAVSLLSCSGSRKFLTDDGVMKFTADNVFGWYVHEMLMVGKRGTGTTFKSWQGKYLAINNDGVLSATADQRPDTSYIFEIETVSCGINRAVELAEKADQTVVFAGNHPLINAREGYDRKNIDLPKRAEELFDAVSKHAKKAALCMVSSYPYATDFSCRHAEMHICHAGPALGTAAAKTIFGDVSPAGRCPMTWYSSADELGNIKDYNIISTKSTYLYYTGKPLYPFGHGLSYTTFEYSDLRLSKIKADKSDIITVSLDLKNTGSVGSDEVVQLYVSAPKLPIALPIKELKGFKRVFVPAGEKLSVSIDIDLSKLGHYDVNTGKEAVWSGSYIIYVGASSEDIRLSAEIDITGDEFCGVDVSKPIPGTLSYSYFNCEFDTDKELNEYILINDWQSFADYAACNMKGYNAVEIEAATMGAGAEVTLSCKDTGKFIAKFALPYTGGRLKFSKFVADAQPVEGISTLRFANGGGIAVKSFRFFNK